MFDGLNLQTALTILPIYIYLFFTGKIIFFSIFIIIFLLFFIFKNFNGKIFLGDSGALIIGYLTAFILIKDHNINFIHTNEYSDFVVSFMIIPVIDLIRLFIIRVCGGKNPFEPDGNHLHHRLLRKFNFKKSIIILFSIVTLPIFFNFVTKFQFNIYIILVFVIIYLYLILITRKRKAYKR